MRIRRFREEDRETLYHIQSASAMQDGLETMSEEDFARWLAGPEVEASANVFVITDDDDELQTWGQAGTLEGIEGEIAGFTRVELRVDEDGYHLLCQGTVHPAQRQRHAGRALLIAALNRARFIAAEFEFEAEQEGKGVYFEVLLPVTDPGAERLAYARELSPVGSEVESGLQLYRLTL